MSVGGRRPLPFWCHFMCHASLLLAMSCQSRVQLPEPSDNHPPRIVSQAAMDALEPESEGRVIKCTGAENLSLYFVLVCKRFATSGGGFNVLKSSIRCHVWEANHDFPYKPFEFFQHPHFWEVAAPCTPRPALSSPTFNDSVFQNVLFSGKSQMIEF